MHIVEHMFITVYYLMQEYEQWSWRQNMEKRSYIMHEDEHKFSSCMWRCVEKEWRLGGEDEGERIVVVVVVSGGHRPFCTPLTQVPHVPKSPPRALRNMRHLHRWSTSSEGAGSKSLWNKRCKKDFKKHTYRPVTTKSSVMPQPCMPYLCYAQNKECNC